jgi:acetolactate synthase I/II/III large subunit
MQSGAELFVGAIERHGIRDIFTLVGDHLNDVLLCAGQRGLRILDMRHEAAVVHAADAWARIHRKPALSLVTGGPGHTNSLTGVATAFATGSPVITVSGSRASTQAQRGAFQELDQMGMVRSVVKWAAEPVSASQIPFYVGRAYSEAMSGRLGPVHLTIPVDLFADRTSQPIACPDPTLPNRPAPDSQDVDRAIALLRKAERPIVIAGSGVWWSEAEAELRAFAEQTQIPVYSITLGRGVLPDDHRLSFGYGDPSLNRAAARAFAEADVVLVLGKRIDFRLGLGGTKLFPARVKFIQVDIHPAEIGLNRHVEVGICADVRATLHAMRLAIGSSVWPELAWLEQVREFRRDWEAWLENASRDSSDSIHPAAFFQHLRDALPPDVLYSWDGGDFVHWGRAMLPALQPGAWLRLGPLATIGAALPNGLALQMAHPGKPVVVITGDGSLGFYIAELDTAVRHGLPIVVIVGNDAGWGLERELQGRERTVGCELRATRYDLVMQGFGGEGENITSLGQVGPAVTRAFASGRPYLLNVNVRGVRSPFTRWKLGDG